LKSAKNGTLLSEIWVVQDSHHSDVSIVSLLYYWYKIYLQVKHRASTVYTWRRQSADCEKKYTVITI